MIETTGRTHLIGGTLAFLGMVTATKGNMGYADMATCLMCCEFGSLLPDIDTESKITEEDIAFKAVSLGLRSLGVKHRGITHTVWASVLFGGLFFVITHLMVGLMNSSTSFLLACVVFFLIHMDSSAYGIKKFGSIIAIGVYLGMPVLMNYMPEDLLSHIPLITVKISALMVGMSVFWGCISHLIFDSCNPQNIMWLHPISKKRIGVPFINITTSSGAESIFAVAVTIASLVWAYLLYAAGYFKLPF